jgi:hypothetical protein
MVGNFSDDFSDWRKETVTYYPWASYDAHGAPSYGASSSVACYIQMIPKLIRDMAGHEVVSSAQIYLVGSSSYNPKDKFVLPDGKYPPIMRIDDFYNEKGVLELTCVYI